MVYELAEPLINAGAGVATVALIYSGIKLYRTHKIQSTVNNSQFARELEEDPTGHGFIADEVEYYLVWLRQAMKNNVERLERDSTESILSDYPVNTFRETWPYYDYWLGNRKIHF